MTVIDGDTGAAVPGAVVSIGRRPVRAGMDGRVVTTLARRVTLWVKASAHGYESRSERLRSAARSGGACASTGP